MSSRKKKKWRGPVPVSHIEKVLLQDNHFAELLLLHQLKRIQSDRYRAGRLLEWQEQSFVLRQAIKETELREMGIPHVSFLPEFVMKTTAPDVRSRRPFRHQANKSSNELITELEHPPTREQTLPIIKHSASGVIHRQKPPIEKGKRLNFTQFYGFKLPLYGPEAEAAKEEKERKIIKRRNEIQEKWKGTKDPRFLSLENSLVRDETSILDTILRKHDRSETSLSLNDMVSPPRNKREKAAMDSLKIRAKNQPHSVFLKSALL
ncbi:uncharacterized protein [Antedon mediterranea]|uniref:uncharacterized protein n=1 Tax=Antedon mediterranea TaxID=105859 RepID=UPI003AF89433